MKELKQVAIMIVSAAVIAFAGAVVDVQVLKADVKVLHGAIVEMAKDIKDIKNHLIRSEQ